MDDLVKRLREPRDLFAQPTITRWWKERLEAADRIEALEAQLAKADALANKGSTLALQLTHIVGQEDIVVVWDEALAAYRATKKGGA